MRDIRQWLFRSLALVLALGPVLGPSFAAGATTDLKTQTWIHGEGGSWKLVSSIFSRQTNKVLRIPSWTGTYEWQGKSVARDGSTSVQRSSQTLTATVYYFPAVERTRDIMISPSGTGFKTDLKTQLPGVEEAYGMTLQVAPGSSMDTPGGPGPGRHVVEVRCRKGRIVTTFAGHPVGVDLVSFAREFVKSNGILGEWKETAILIHASQGDKELYLKGSVAADETYRGVLKLSASENLILDFHLRRVVCRANQTEIQRSETTPLEDAKVVVTADRTTVKGVSDSKGIARVELGKISQRRAITFKVAMTGQERETLGLLRLRYGRDKERLLDSGRYLPTSAPAGVSFEEVSKSMLAFFRSIYQDDAGHFPRTVEQDRLGTLEYSPRPEFLHTLAWHLAKAAKDKESIEDYRNCLPLDRLKDVSLATQDLEDGQITSLFESVEAVLALELETGDLGWLRVARRKLDENQFRTGKSWGERTARRCLALWRIAELSKDSSLELLAKRETDALLRALSTSLEPTEFVITKRQVKEISGSGAPGGHAWAALALFKGFELIGESTYKAVAVTQVKHLVEKHLERGVVGYSHEQPGERPGASRSTLSWEGAYPELAATIHALLLGYHHTLDRGLSDSALAARTKLLGYWRKEYGGFGKLDYWEGVAPGAGGDSDEKSEPRPVVLRKVSSSYQQPWALVAFFPSLYPYWGDGIKDETKSRGILDFLFQRRDD